MGLMARLRGLLAETLGGTPRSPGSRRDLQLPERLSTEELCRRLDVLRAELEACPVEYTSFSVPKRSGGRRRLSAPAAPLRRLQRRILRRLLARLRCHPAATGFERGHSIVTHALPHVGKAVVVRLDIEDFFPSIDADWVYMYFRQIGWSREASELLMRLCTWEGSLPQGAPTSPRLSNLVNIQLDAALETLAHSHGAAYSRYADDITYSFAIDDRNAVYAVLRATKLILKDEYDYTLHQGRKLHIRREYEQQRVTGLVVNRRVALPRRTRRWLRAVRHRRETTGQATLTDEQLAGWTALERMVLVQAGRDDPAQQGE